MRKATKQISKEKPQISKQQTNKMKEGTNTMTKRKAILTSVLIMIPTGGILLFLIMNSFWNSIYFCGVLAAYGFYHLWLSIIRWLQVPDSGETFRKRSGKRGANNA